MVWVLPSSCMLLSPVLSYRILWAFCFIFIRRILKALLAREAQVGLEGMDWVGTSPLPGTLETPSLSASAPPLGSYLTAWGPDAGQAVNTSGKSFPGWPQRWL